MPRLARISLGSNLGDRGSILRDSLNRLTLTPGIEVRDVSRFLETAPVGGPAGQSPFLNAAATLATDLEPIDLFRELKRIESEFGRERKVHWGARTLDLDLLLFEQVEFRSRDLEIPHPRLAFRRFVLDPLAEIAPDAVEPSTGLTIAALSSNLSRRPRRLTVVGEPAARERFHDRWGDRFAEIGWGLSRFPERGTFLVAVEPGGDSREGNLPVASERWRRLVEHDRVLATWTHPPAPAAWIDPEDEERSVDDLAAMCSGLDDA